MVKRDSSFIHYGLIILLGGSNYVKKISFYRLANESKSLLQIFVFFR